MLRGDRVYPHVSRIILAKRSVCFLNKSLREKRLRRITMARWLMKGYEHKVRSGLLNGQSHHDAIDEN
jgi:hypothetical protein